MEVDNETFIEIQFVGFEVLTAVVINIRPLRYRPCSSYVISRFGET
jgi:hypothetical protein